MNADLHPSDSKKQEILLEHLVKENPWQVIERFKSGKYTMNENCGNYYAEALKKISFENPPAMTHGPLINILVVFGTGSLLYSADTYFIKTDEKMLHSEEGSVGGGGGVGTGAGGGPSSTHRNGTPASPLTSGKKLCKSSLMSEQYILTSFTISG